MTFQSHSIIFEKLWLLREVPEAWKKANVTLIFKKAKKEDPGNYRPVRLTSVPGEMIDHVILEAISKRTKDKKVMGSSQHRFMKETSCLTNLIVFYDEVTSSLFKEKKQWMLLTLLRLLTLFPVTSSDKILKYGLDKWTVRWTENSLSCWAQRVVTSCTKSS